MKRQMTAIIVGTVMAITGSTLSVSAATTAQKTNPAVSSFSELATGDLGVETNELKDAQTLSFNQGKTRKK